MTKFDDNSFAPNDSQFENELSMVSFIAHPAMRRGAQRWRQCHPQKVESIVKFQLDFRTFSMEDETATAQM